MKNELNKKIIEEIKPLTLEIRGMLRNKPENYQRLIDSFNIEIYGTTMSKVAEQIGKKHDIKLTTENIYNNCSAEFLIIRRDSLRYLLDTLDKLQLETGSFNYYRSDYTNAFISIIKKYAIGYRNKKVIELCSERSDGLMANFIKENTALIQTYIFCCLEESLNDYINVKKNSNKKEIKKEQEKSIAKNNEKTIKKEKLPIQEETVNFSELSEAERAKNVNSKYKSCLEMLTKKIESENIRSINNPRSVVQYLANESFRFAVDNLPECYYERYKKLKPYMIKFLKNIFFINLYEDFKNNRIALSSYGIWSVLNDKAYVPKIEHWIKSLINNEKDFIDSHDNGFAR